MELYEGILTRRSIRKYKSTPVPKELVEKLLKAAMYAPSAVNKQPWHYIICKDKDKFQQIIDVHPNAKMLMGAPLGIVICGDTQLAHGNGIYWPVDCAAATQNLLLAAHGLGLGAVWIGIYPREERIAGLEKIFQLPSNIKPFAMVALGHPNETKEQPERYREDRIHWETY